MGQLVPAIVGAFKAAGPALSIGGTLLSTAGAVSAGNAAKAQGEWQQKQYEQQAKSEQAAASQAADNERRQKEIVLSRARAVGAASGGGIDYGLMGDIEEEGTYRQGIAIWEGNERATGLQTQGQAAAFEGRQAQKASRYRAAGTLLGGADSFFEKYG